jgi:hypothetical protein
MRFWTAASGTSLTNTAIFTVSVPPLANEHSGWYPFR